MTLRRFIPARASEPAGPVDDAAVAALAERLAAAAHRRLGRSLALLVVDAGGCNGCELEVRMLKSVVYDLARFGLGFASTPRHADVLLVTGPVTHAMFAALGRAHEAMADPKYVVAVGDCAIDGGVFKDSYAVAGGADRALPVDLLIRGCPPTPAALLDGLRALIEANRER